ncbi:Type 1 glutamine amidotransferase-like domain-containing protein [Streptomyces sp. NPDC050400]|uniref:Type 1 glutamine amidotransferase-like domain-containing protein n=1 Tax=Streptomyces sp. NPDC050400 TaxID=3365610 RepID=UPI0037A12CAA
MITWFVLVPLEMLMQLLLSSWFLTPASLPLALPPPFGGGRAGIVLNALDQYGPTRGRDYGREALTLESLGYTSEELDLREYFRAPQELHRRLAGLDLVWVLGGNAFVLARAMNQARFGKALAVQAPRPEFVYGGYSAGACVAGPDLQGIELIDDPAVLPEGYCETAVPQCLGLVADRIVPHWRSEHPDAEGAERAAKYLNERGLQYRCLRDGETMYVDRSLQR